MVPPAVGGIRGAAAEAWSSAAGAEGAALQVSYDELIGRTLIFD